MAMAVGAQSLSLQVPNLVLLQPLKFFTFNMTEQKSYCLSLIMCHMIMVCDCVHDFQAYKDVGRAAG